MFRLTIDMIFDLLTHLWPFEIAAEMKTKCKIWLKCQFSHTTINHRKNFNVSLDALMCPLQIINDSEPLSLTLHGLNACFIHHPSNVKNYLIDQNKKIFLFWTTYFYTFLPILSSKFKIPITTEGWSIFQHLENRHLMAQQTAHQWYTQKSKIG